MAESMRGDPTAVPATPEPTPATLMPVAD
jgi:hypothetical protein